jgi:AraC-like DNA-binding protein
MRWCKREMSDGVEYKRLAVIPGLVLGAGRFESYSFGRHYHLDYHIGLVVEGAQRQQCNRQSALLTPGRISLMPPGEIHDGCHDGDQPCVLKTFRLAPDLLQQLMQDLAGSARPTPLSASIVDQPLLASQLVQLHHTLQHPVAVSALALQSEWLSALYCLFAGAGSIEPQLLRGGLSREQLRRVRDYCMAHLDQKITLDELAAECQIGRFHFLRQFRQTVGMTPHAWLLRLRLEHACALLARRQQSIASVAQLVGFYDQSHFNRAFRQAFGVSPSAY